MRSFLKFFLAAFTALVVFSLVGFLILLAIAGGLASSEKITITSKSVLVIDLSKGFSDKKPDNTIARLSGDHDIFSTSLYDAIRLIQYAKKDSAIKGIYLKCNGNANGFAASEEIRNALLDFKGSNKFIIAYGDVISQKAYFVGSTADKIYCNPKGVLEWKGFASQLFFMKNTLKKLEIEPQIFYAGKFKSATEPLREEKMTDANRLQTTVWLGDLYNHFLLSTASKRNIDTATLHRYANDFMIKTPADGLKYKLLDGLKYDDEVKDEIREKLEIAVDDKIEFVPLGSYGEAVNIGKYSSDRIAVIYAEGDIVYGKGGQQQVGSDEYRNLISKATKDKNIKAIVLRINSPGGSALASEIIWRETALARKAGKPFVVSMGDVAASGGYYIACAADSIFAQPNTITGSIGVFGIVPNMQGFFKNKLGVTFDGVKTAPHADIETISRPLNESERRIIQSEIDTIYYDFKTRVSDGRKKDMLYVDSIAQGRVWTGIRAKEVGLVDRIGGLDDAIACAARMANLTEYGVREYPEPVSLWDMLKNNYEKTIKMEAIREELSLDEYQLYKKLKTIKAMTGTSQARMPFELIVD
ncbi:MAG TPA: signal peptide peptidase SppA [Agriterribacter sp.]|nr:signal peptide peptidase SppA [Agriterribacter sp.]